MSINAFYHLKEMNETHQLENFSNQAHIQLSLRTLVQRTKSHCWSTWNL